MNQKSKQAVLDLVAYVTTYAFGFFVVGKAIEWIDAGLVKEPLARFLNLVVPIVFVATLSGTVRDFISPHE